MRGLYYRVLDQTGDFVHSRYQCFSSTDIETGREVTHYHTG
jgi:hypothetical protein